MFLTFLCLNTKNEININIPKYIVLIIIQLFIFKYSYVGDFPYINSVKSQTIVGNKLKIFILLLIINIFTTLEKNVVRSVKVIDKDEEVKTVLIVNAKVKSNINIGSIATNVYKTCVISGISIISLLA